MAGMIIGFYGFQRSGKTLLAYKFAQRYTKLGIKCYTNMNVKESGFIKISGLSEMPLNTEPKVLLLDEVYSFMDSRNWRNSSNTSLFFNTIGKQNCLLLMTAISPDMVEKRLREQHNIMVLAKGNESCIHYRMIDCQRMTVNEYVIKKDEQLFRNVFYDTLQVPDLVDCDMKDFADRVKEYNKQIKS